MGGKIMMNVGYGKYQYTVIEKKKRENRKEEASKSF